MKIRFGWGSGRRGFKGEAGLREDEEQAQNRPRTQGPPLSLRVGASEETRSRGGPSVQRWTGSIQRGNHMLLESSMEKWKQLRLQLCVSWVQIRALWLTVRLADFSTYFVGLS